MNQYSTRKQYCTRGALAARHYSLLSILALALTLTGCWTISETPYPTTNNQPPTTDHQLPTLTLAGFESYLTEYEAVHGYRAVYVPGHYGRHHCEPSHFEVVPSVDYRPQRRSTDMFLRRAQDQFEKTGFTLGTGITDRTVEVRFEGPFVSQADELKKLAWNLFTAFFCDAGYTRWTAHLRIRDSKTGKLLFHQDYDQPYEAKVIGLLPLFCAPASDAIDPVQMQSWCLAALTDRAVADATAFLTR